MALMLTKPIFSILFLKENYNQHTTHFQPFPVIYHHNPLSSPVAASAGSLESNRNKAILILPSAASSPFLVVIVATHPARLAIAAAPLARAARQVTRANKQTHRFARQAHKHISKIDSVLVAFLCYDKNRTVNLRDRITKNSQSN